MQALTFAPNRSWVRGTRLVRQGCPDPWAKDFQVEEHLWAIYANRLREMAHLGTVVAEVVMVLAGGLIGVLLTELMGHASRTPSTDGPLAALAVTVLLVAFAAMARLTLLREWQSAGDRYRELAVARVNERLAIAQDYGAAVAT